MGAVLTGVDTTQAALIGPGPVSRVAAAAASAGVLRQNVEKSFASGAQAQPAAYIGLADLLSGAEGSEAGKANLVQTLRALGAVRGTVVATGPDNTATIDIEGVQVTMKLARAHGAGEQVIIALSDGVAGESPEAELSPTGRLLSALLASTGQASESARASAEATPVALNASPLDTAQLAERIEQSLRQSGMFYESHLAAWVQGRTALADLRREPQGRQPPAQAKAEGGDGIPAPLSGLVSRQLDTLEHGAVRWTGQPWPGQLAELVIEDADHASDAGQGQAGSAGQDRPHTWRVKLKLTMPSLGEVEAQVALSGSQVTVALSAPERAAGALEAAGSELSSALAARGLSAQLPPVQRHG